LSIYGYSFALLQNNDGSQKISGDSLKNVYKSFVDEYPIVSIEDPFDQDDWVHYAKMTQEIGEPVQIVGDDLLVTNPTVCSLFWGIHFLIFSFSLVISLAYFTLPCRGLRRRLRRSLAMLFSSRYVWFKILHFNCSS
jgi:hypothetical protein